ncbi:MAG: hypothetical protein LBI77_04100, partial [Puniceicoccales bacterium]|nr:hypothetical protein [Puniceicoccales bacterium]
MKKFLHTIVLFSSFGMPFAALSSENFNLPSDLPSDLPENIRKNIGNSRYRALRYLACQILSENSKGVIDLFNAKTPTQQLMKEAKESLENESYS